jgi:hypothetical protein
VQDVDPAELHGGHNRHRADFLAPGDIGADEQGVAAGLANQRHGLLPGPGIDIGHDHPHPLAGGRDRRGAADA